MKQRGRKSSASLSTITPSGHARPDPPGELTGEQAAEWRDIVARMPSDWFTRETWPLLEAYCTHIDRHRLLARELAGFDPARLADAEGRKQYDCLTTLAARESNCMIRLATKLRLTQQARYGARAASTASRGGNGPAPWET